MSIEVVEDSQETDILTVGIMTGSEGIESKEDSQERDTLKVWMMTGLNERRVHGKMTP